MNMDPVPESLWCRMFENGYDLQQNIGYGNFSRAYMGVDQRNNQVVAVKVVRKKPLSSTRWDDVALEIILLHKIKHKHIVKMFNWMWDSDNVYIVQEFCAGGTLTSVIKDHGALTESACKYVVQQLASAIKYLRAFGVSHIDLKPDNIFMIDSEEMSIKLGDFGLAKIMNDDTHLFGIAGSPVYMAPEVAHRNFGIQADLWSMGIIVFECMMGEAPYAKFTTEMIEYYFRIHSPINIPLDKISPECADLLKGLLKYNLTERMTHEEFYAHPFVKLDDYLRICALEDTLSGDHIPPKLSSRCRFVPYLQHPFQSVGYDQLREVDKPVNNMKELKICFRTLKKVIKGRHPGIGYDLEDESILAKQLTGFDGTVFDEDYFKRFDEFEGYAPKKRNKMKKFLKCFDCFNCFTIFARHFKTRSYTVK